MTRIASLLLGLAAAAASLAGLAPAAAGQGKASARLFTRADGELVRAALEIRVQPGWHLYHTELGPPDAVGMPLAVSLSGGDVVWGPVVLPEPHRFEQPGLGKGGSDTWILGHEGTIVAHAVGRLAGAAPAPEAIEAELSGLTCQDDGSCIPYRETVASRGPGADALFAGFPALEPPGLPGEGSAATGSSLPSTGAGSKSKPSLGGGTGAAFLEDLGVGRAPAGGHASARLYTRVEEGRVRAAIEVRIEPGWHLYHEDKGAPDAIGKPTRVRMEAPGVTWSRVRFPEPHRYEQPGLGAGGADTWIYGHEGTIVLHALGRFEGEPPSAVAAVIDGLTCVDDGSCVEYRETVASSGAGPDALFADFPLGEADLSEPSSTAGLADPGASSGPAPAPGAVDYAAWTWSRDFEARETEVTRGLGMWLLLAFVAGMILNVMPCVLPVISIKVLSFVQQAGEDRRRIFALGLAFAAGILVVFLVLAGLAVGLNKSWGEQFQDQGFLIVMIGVVFAFGLSLFGLYELGVPKGVGGLAGMSREGMVDAFFKGMLATVLATPCSGPFLGSTLTWTLAQTPLTIFTIFAMLGVGMAFPYVVLTANPAFLKLIPKPGPWMETFKQAMGFVLMLTVVYLMISLEQHLLLFTVAFLLFVGLGCWWWGRFATFDQSRPKRYATLVVALAIPALGAQVSFGWFRGMFEQKPESIAWVDFEPDLFERYLDEGRNVFVDFTADWCPNCKYNENFVFETEEIRGRIAAKDVVAMKADITHDSPKTDLIEDLMDQLGAVSIPFLAVFPADDPTRPFTRKDVVKVATMAEIFDSLPDAPPRPRSLAP